MKKVIAILALLVILAFGAFFAYKQLDLNTSSNNPENLTIGINNDSNAETALVISGPEGESIVALKETRDGQNYVKKLIMTSVEGHEAELNLNDSGLVDLVEIDGNRIEYSNHTNTTVDIKVTDSEGNITTLEKQPINVPAMQLAKSNSIPVAHAANPNASVHYASQPYGSSTNLDADIDTGALASELLTSGYMGYSFIACGASLIALVPSLGTSLSWGLLSCGSVITQTVILHVDLKPCRTEEQVKNEDYSCLVDALNDGLTRVTGPQISGTLTDTETKELLEGVKVTVFRNTGSFKTSWTSFADGKYYTGDYTEQGSFTASYVKDGYESRNLKIIVNADRIVITDSENDEKLLDKTYEYKGKFILYELPISLVPIKFSISGEIIDSVEGTGIAGARIRVNEVAFIVLGDQLFDFKADSNGMFFFSPPPVENILNVRVDAPGYLAKNLVLEIDKDQKVSMRTGENNSALSAYLETIKLVKAGNFDGKWKGTSTTDSPETADAFCYDASIEFNLIGGLIIRGTADFGVGSFALDGNIKEDGNMTGFARNSENKGTFSGTAIADKATGDWWDELGCKGKFNLERVLDLEGLYKELE